MPEWLQVCPDWCDSFPHNFSIEIFTYYWPSILIIMTSPFLLKKIKVNIMEFLSVSARSQAFGFYYSITDKIATVGEFS